MTYHRMQLPSFLQTRNFTGLNLADLSLSSRVLSCLLIAIACQTALLSQQPAPADVRPLPMRETVERELKGDEAHAYSISIAAGQLLDLVVTQKGIDVVVTLLDEQGRKIAEIDSPNGSQGPESLTAVIDVAGNHQVLVRSLDKAAPLGRYEIRIVELRAATEKDRSRLAAQKAFAEAEAFRSQPSAASYRRAIERYNAALPHFRAVGDVAGEGLTLSNLGRVHNDLGEKQQAIKYLNEALPLRRAAANKRGEGVTLQLLGSVYRDVGDLQEALKKFNEALPLFREIKDKRWEGVTLLSVASVYDDMGEQQRALHSFNEVLALFRSVGDKRGEAVTLNNIGKIYYGLGDMTMALRSYNESLPITRGVGDKRGEAATLNNIGAAAAATGDHRQALKAYNDALPLLRETGDKRVEADTLNNIGSVSSDLGEKDKALDLYRQSLRLAREVSDRGGEAVSLINIGRAFNAVGNKLEAAKSFSESYPLLRLVRDRRGEAAALDNLSQTVASANPRLGVFYGKLSVGNYQILRANIRGIDKDFQKSFLRSIEKVYRRLADSLIRQNRLAEAQQVLDLFKDQQYFDFTAPTAQTPPALTELETRVARSLDSKLEAVAAAIKRLDTLRRGLGGRSPTEKEAADIGELDRELQNARVEFQAVLSAAEMEFSSAAHATDKISELAGLRELKSALSGPGQKAVAIYTLLGEEEYRALVVTHDNIFSVSTPIRAKDLNDRALRLSRLLRSPRYDPRTEANALYKVVFGPLAGKLPRGTTTILWSLDGNLRYVPMAALYDGKRYLAERYLNVVFTRSDSERLKRPRGHGLTGAGFGTTKAYTLELSGRRFDASALPAVRSELRRIFGAQGAGGKLKGEVLLDEKFTRRAMVDLIGKRSRLTHIASHFTLEPGDEARSFLLLGDGTPFTLDEMKSHSDLFSGVDLLTLSACETASQKPDANGREVDGFAELAQRLGAGAVMASLWEVSDSSTAELMSRFYSNYTSGNAPSKAAALQSAQLALLRGSFKVVSRNQRQIEREKDARQPVTKARLFRRSPLAPYAHPFYWAPFILIGNWK